MACVPFELATKYRQGLCFRYVRSAGASTSVRLVLVEFVVTVARLAIGDCAGRRRDG